MGCCPVVQRERTHGCQQTTAIPTVASVRPIASVPRDCWPEATLAPCLVSLSIRSLPYKHHLCPQGQLKRAPALRKVSLGHHPWQLITVATLTCKKQQSPMQSGCRTDSWGGGTSKPRQSVSKSSASVGFLVAVTK